MPLGVTLSTIRRELRAAIGHSRDISQGVNFQSTLDETIRQNQEMLWASHEWPHLVFKVTAPFTAGTRYLDYPAKLLFAPVNEVWLKDGSSNGYTYLEYGIPMSCYNSWDSEAGQQSWPIQRWANAPKFDSGTNVAIAGDGQFEFWPVPAKAGNIMVVSQALLPPLVADTDRCLIDDRAIVMFAAAQILARQKNEDAPMQLQRAQEYLRRILGNQGGKKRRTRVLGGNSYFDDSVGQNGQTPWIDYIPMNAGP